MEKLNTLGGDAFKREDAMVEFGVGKNMVRSIRLWGLATGVLEEDHFLHVCASWPIRAEPATKFRARPLKLVIRGLCLNSRVRGP